eukprot:m.18866 g.18866  ORF g.18866 m.18866 type:complete len:279 (+) comp7458_c1_seq1:319-1155(+)
MLNTILCKCLVFVELLLIVEQGHIIGTLFRNISDHLHSLEHLVTPHELEEDGCFLSPSHNEQRHVDNQPVFNFFVFLSLLFFKRDSHSRMGASNSTVTIYEFQVGQRAAFKSNHGFLLHGTIHSKSGSGPTAIYGFLQDQGTEVRRVRADQLTPTGVSPIPLPPGTTTVVYQTTISGPPPPAYGAPGPYPPQPAYPPQQGYPPQQAGYPPQGYAPQQAYPPQGYPPQGTAAPPPPPPPAQAAPAGYPTEGYPAQGYNMNGYTAQGYGQAPPPYEPAKN